MALEPAGANAEQIKYWNEVAAPKWVALQRLIDEQIAPLGRKVMDRAMIRTGERVLDVGCGCGETTVELARRVGPSGSIDGVDISTPMLERAREAVRAAGLANVRLENADAQTCAFAPASVDLVFSRFGVMFFADPAAAFANLRRALRPDGRVSFVCWQPVQRNPWMFVPLMATAQVIPLPPAPAPDAPGPFSFGDPERVRGILSRAGYEAIALEDLEETLTVGGEGASLEQVVDFLLQIGPAGAALREAGPDAAVRVAAVVGEALAPFHGARGVRMESACWIVTARNP